MDNSNYFEQTDRKGLNQDLASLIIAYHAGYFDSEKYLKASRQVRRRIARKRKITQKSMEVVYILTQKLSSSYVDAVKDLVTQGGEYLFDNFKKVYNTLIEYDALKYLAHYRKYYDDVYTRGIELQKRRIDLSAKNKHAKLPEDLTILEIIKDLQINPIKNE